MSRWKPVSIIHFMNEKREEVEEEKKKKTILYEWH